MKPFLLVAALVAVGLAGCTEDGPETDGPGTTVTSETGAISCLLVDDRFRPLELMDAPESEFQTRGFILLQETGQQTRTTQNGECGFSDLEPGRYTLRVEAEGHEAAPVVVTVNAGQFTESTLVARRISSATSTVITQEYAVFVACSVALLLPVTVNECDLDLSGESNRWSFETDYTAIVDVRNLVMEMKANQVADYEVDMWWVPEDLTTDSLWYASDIFQDDYTRILLTWGETNEEHADYTSNDPWLNDHGFQTDFYIFGTGSQELGGLSDNFLIGGVGVHLGTKARFMHSLFIGDPDVDVASYCLLCEG